MIKVYYKIEFKLISPLSVGSGENDSSDKDVIKNSKGEPFIPGTSIAGVYRNLCDKETADQYFGPLFESGKEVQDSCIRVYDASLKSHWFAVTNRDGVGLDQYKTVIKGAKYDFEVVEPGSSFVTYLEQNITEKTPEDIAGRIVSFWNRNGIKFGSKTTRGYGETKITKAWRKTFDLSDEDAVLNWLQFRMYDDQTWEPGDELNEYTITKGLTDGKIRVTMGLKQKGGISIRKYTTRVNSQENPEPDYEQMAYERNGEMTPFIPGTSWAGAFRHHIHAVKPELDLSCVFGKLGSKSPIIFHESFLTEGVSKMVTRNAIDRFGGGTEQGALYTERTYYNGSTELVVEWPVKNADEGLARAFALSVADLHMGMLSVGGLTAIGRGIFEITDIRIEKDGETESFVVNPEGKQMPEQVAGQIYDFVLKQVTA